MSGKRPQDVGELPGRAVEDRLPARRCYFYDFPPPPACPPARPLSYAKHATIIASFRVPWRRLITRPTPPPPPPPVSFRRRRKPIRSPPRRLENDDRRPEPALLTNASGGLLPFPRHGGTRFAFVGCYIFVSPIMFFRSGKPIFHFFFPLTISSLLHSVLEWSWPGRSPSVSPFDVCPALLFGRTRSPRTRILRVQILGLLLCIFPALG